MTPHTSRLRDTQFSHRRTIFGHRVLVGIGRNSDIDGYTPANYSVRIKDPDHGDRDFTCTTAFYWQAFNEATRYLRTLQ